MNIENNTVEISTQPAMVGLQYVRRIFSSGNIKLINADCMDIMKQYPDKYFDWAIIDPPYGIEWSKRTDKSFVERHNNTKAFNSDMEWDKKPEKEYWIELFRISKNQIVWGINYFSSNFESFIPIFWDKMNGESQYSDGELCGITTTKKARILKHAYIGKYNPEPLKIHPTQKPIFIYDKLYDWYIDKKDKIIDTHLGSGSNAITAHYFGVSEFLGIEIKENHFENSIKRFIEKTRALKLDL